MKKIVLFSLLAGLSIVKTNAQKKDPYKSSVPENYYNRNNAEPINQTGSGRINAKQVDEKAPSVLEEERRVSEYNYELNKSRESEGGREIYLTKPKND